MTRPAYQTILYKVENNILRITLNRPDKRNAFNEQMVEDLNAIFLTYKDNDDIIGVSVTGAGESFCAGADLTYLQSLGSKSFEDNLKDSNNLKEMYWNIFTFPKPTVGLINGPAVAGGCGLVTALDIAIASKNAIFGYPEVKIGFVASIVSVFLIHTVGLAHAKQLLYTGELIDSVRAEKIGLVNTIISKDDLDVAANAFFSQIRNNSPQALFQTKSLLLGFHEDMIKKKLEYACRVNAESRQTDDFKEGLKSFLEKRQPIWGKT
jgi:methylglutaconyl-CoA hydratase